jgi:superfamily II DNA or RNA helicase
LLCRPPVRCHSFSKTIAVCSSEKRSIFAARPLKHFQSLQSKNLDAILRSIGINREMPKAVQNHYFKPGQELDLSPGSESLTLAVTFDLADGRLRLSWKTPEEREIANGSFYPLTFVLLAALEWSLDIGGNVLKDRCNAWPASTRALLKRIRQKVPGTVTAIRAGLLADKNIGPVFAGQWHEIKLPAGSDSWKWLGFQVQQFAQLAVAESLVNKPPADRGRAAMLLLGCAAIGIAAPQPRRVDAEGRRLLDLRVSFNTVEVFIEFVWTEPPDGTIKATGRVCPSLGGHLAWELKIDGRSEPAASSHQRASVRKILEKWLSAVPTDRSTFSAFWVKRKPGTGEAIIEQEPPFGSDEPPYPFLENNIVAMAKEFLGPAAFDLAGFDLDAGGLDVQNLERRLLRKEQRRAEEQSKLRDRMERVAEERRRRESEQKKRAKLSSAPSNSSVPPQPPPAAPKPPAAVPRAPLHFVMPPLAFQETTFPLESLRGYQLRELAALWWVSNQSDDLLCLPHCRIMRLEYQTRTALRVLGPLRGRALLSDEVGLGKTIESGLVIKELLTRGMVKRFLILTVPSLVDQWEEELSDKFGLAAATTNHAGLRDNAQSFWRENAGIVASLHTLKQPAHLEIARQVHWDILIVDEAHYLRNRESQAWQAVNVLPRQFLLLLTATPVQNSLEEIYNLVTLIQPGQLPSPKEFRARFIDPKRPRQPREPDELRRLLGQVMIRNTRANAGIQLPPRRAETVLFQPEAPEAEFWREWEVEFRAALAHLNASQASFWGRLVLQAAGSSPAAWRGALAKFPDRNASAAWREKTMLESTWRKKCELIPPITRIEGGAVIFTQFLETQRALAEYLQQAGVATFVINGSIPAAERQPITEQFRKSGGALLLTQSGTEGRNLQFAHRLVNFDLPWNPMEIEQRIGRLHRLGQTKPVRIYNMVQAGTLQEHLLQILQEKLNLFELVVGETGLVLGDRFSSDEFAEEIFRRWRESEGHVAESFTTLGEELAAARGHYDEIKKLDETLFAKDYESL